MSTAVHTRTMYHTTDAAPCAFRKCEGAGAWVGTPTCHHSQLFCTAHMLRLARPGVMAHCTVCHEVTPGAAVTWKEYRP